MARRCSLPAAQGPAAANTVTPPIICTIIAANYRPQARVLARSITRHHPDARLQVLVIDDDVGAAKPLADEPFDIIAPAELPISAREFHEMAACYQVMELATAVKPALLMELLARHESQPVLYLDPDVMVFAPLDDVFAIAEQHPIILTPHATVPMPRDGCKPTEYDILASGAWNLGCIAVSAGAAPFLRWWAQRLRLDALADHANMLFTDQRWVDLAAGYFDIHPRRDPGYNVAYWNIDQRTVECGSDGYLVNGSPLVFFHFSGFDPRRPHLLSKHQGDRPRIKLSEYPVIRGLCRTYGDLLSAEGLDQCRELPYRWDQLPDGAPLTRAIRASIRRALLDRDTGGASERPPDPFDPSSLPAFWNWLASPEPANNDAPAVPRLLFEVYKQRGDLRAAFPHVENVDADRLRRWGWEHGRSEGLVPENVAMIAIQDLGPEVQWGGARLNPGFLIAGYLEAELGLGEAARRALDTMDAAGIPCGAFPFRLTRSRQSQSDAARPPLRTDLNTTIVWLNADQLGGFARSVGSAFFEGRYTVGYWAWETETPHWLMAQMSRFVDEIWTPSEYCKRCIEGATDTPVLTFPHPVLKPSVPAAPVRRRLGMPDGFVFLFMFDFFSTVGRKNPVGLIEAFCRAFEPGEGPALVLKSINGSHAELEMERLRYAVGDRRDIVLIDEHFSNSECAGLLAEADCYVSLHRAEGFGLTIADAMALGTPVIASGYSGNLEFTSDDTAYLVPVKRAVVGPDAGPYPPGDAWAEPDLDIAAELMRRVYRDPAEARRKAATATRAILTEHGHARATRFLTAQFERIQDLMHTGFTSDVAVRVEAMLAASGSG